MTGKNIKTIWIDMDNSPHVVFFRPIISELEKKGYRVVISVRDCFQVVELADLFKLKYKRIGRHYGKNKLMKGLGLIIRTLEMLPFAFKEKPSLTLSHGSRSQLFLSNLLRIKSVMIFDYECAKALWIAKPNWSISPDLISSKPELGPQSTFFNYPGIKEDVYAASFKPDGSFLKDLGISEKDILATIRPPATEAHYHNPESEELFHATIQLFLQNESTCMIILPRDNNQKEFIRQKWHDACKERRIIIPEKAIDGLDLIWHSDLVVSGGGTMNREATALNVPVYSIFRGPIGNVDRYLEKKNRLVLLKSVADVNSKIKVEKRVKASKFINKSSSTLNSIIDTIDKLAKSL